MVFALWLECLVSYLKTKIIPSLSPNQYMVVWLQQVILSMSYKYAQCVKLENITH